MAEAAYVKHRVPELCRHFLRGRCRFGSACRFSHQREDVALPFGHRQYVQSQASHAIRGNEGGWRFRVLSYNVLADCLAQEHKELYTSAPRFSLEWSFRSRLIIREILHHSPDIVCLQEVDRFPEFQHALQPHGYEGVFTKRTGDRSDGLAMFWRINAMQPVDQRFLRFKDLGMKDNVAQLLVFQRRVRGSSGQTSSDGSAGSLSGQKRRQAESRHLRFDSSSEGEAQDWVEDATVPAGAGSAAAPGGPPLLVCAQTHVLFNPKRGDLKIAQVRTLLEHVNSLCLQQQTRCGRRAAAMVMGDFNSTAGSPMHQFLMASELDLSQHDRRRMSGQVESRGHDWRALQQSFLEQQGAACSNVTSQAPASSWPGQPPALVLGAASTALSGRGEYQRQLRGPPYSPPLEQHSRDSMRPWSAADARLAAGGDGSTLMARHPLTIDSVYRVVTGQEPYTTVHDKFIGCVDYIWYTPGDGSDGAAHDYRLLPLGVLQPPPLQTLHCALPSPSWPSDHISLVADFALICAEAPAEA